MAQPELCPHCLVGWPILTGDMFCGFCAAPLFEFEVQPEDRFHYHDCREPQIMRIKVTNSGLGALNLKAPGITSIKGLAIEAPTSEFTLDPKRERWIHIRVEPGALEGRKAELTIETVDNQSPLKRTLPIRFYKAPQIKMVTEEGVPTQKTLPVLFKENEPVTTLQLRLIVTEGALQLEKITCRDPWIRLLDPIQCRLRKNGCSQPITFIIEKKDMPLAQKINTVLYLHLDGRSQKLEVPMTLIPDMNPFLEFRCSQDETIIEGTKKTIRARVINRPGGHLVVTRIDAQPSEIIAVKNINSPLYLSGKGSLQEIELEILSPPKKEATCVIKLHSNSYTDPILTHELKIEVLQQKKHPYYIGVDFGTTNSCVACVDDKKDFNIETVPLQTMQSKIPTPGQKISPSSIIYHKNTNQNGEYHVGHEAETYRTGKDGRYYIHSSKRWLGHTWKRPFPYQPKQPEEVIGDIIGYLIDQSERQIGEKINRCVASHPTMFSKKQKELLKRALDHCGVEKSLLIDEASAAAIGVVFERIRTKGYQDDAYNMLLFDFGGGTIDMVLISVAIENRSLLLKPLAWGGDPNLGGDDITQCIVELILKKIQTDVKQTIQKDLHYTIPLIQPRKPFTESISEDYDKALIRNSKLLYTIAEDMKIALTTKPSSKRSFSSLEIISENRIISIRALTKNETSLDITITREEIEEELKVKLSHVMHRIEAMLRETGIAVPDIVYLAGQSSRMPIVQTMIANLFNKKETKSKPPEILLLKNPKECVAIGAAQYGLSMSMPGSNINLEEFSNKTHARYGIAESSFGKAIFRQLIPRNEPLPCARKISIPIREELHIQVYKNYGTGNDLKENNALKVDSFYFDLQNKLSPDRDHADLIMIVHENDEIELQLVLDNEKITAHIKQKAPPFAETLP